jgi:hypothetical protein
VSLCGIQYSFMKLQNGFKVYNIIIGQIEVTSWNLRFKGHIEILSLELFGDFGSYYCFADAGVLRGVFPIGISSSKLVFIWCVEQQFIARITGKRDLFLKYE